jgi:hypothetical protein
MQTLGKIAATLGVVGAIAVASAAPAAAWYGHLPNGARTVRLAALMAGNALIFLKLIDMIKTLPSFWQSAGLIVSFRSPSW